MVILFSSLFVIIVSNKAVLLDTDSVFFTSDEGQWNPPTGVFLGDLTDELKPGQYIREFVSLGAKSYAFQCNDGKECIKIKGFTLNGSTRDIINYGKMLDLLEDPTSKIAVPQRGLKRKIDTLDIVETEGTKNCKFLYDKRLRLYHKTLPWGYCED